jgi:hypothetical protein
MVMPKVKVIKSVLWNFLGSYMSRYSDYCGYWLFGFLVENLGELEFNLLAREAGSRDAPPALAAWLAVRKFEDQLRKAGLELSQVQEARLRISRLPGAIGSLINGHSCSGYKVTLKVIAVMKDGKRYERERQLFVAPHNPEVELRSARGGRSRG